MTYKELLLSYLKEDLGGGDVTSESVLDGESAVAQVVCKRECVLAGVREAEFLFDHMGLHVDVHHQDGERIEAGDVVITVRGDAGAIFGVERLVLNLLMRMSGIATLTGELTDRCRAINPEVRIAATRKTTPGFRMFEKRAVMLGGGDPHRMALDDAVIIKDNHITVAGSIAEALKRASRASFSKKIEVEAQSLEDAEAATHGGTDIVMLDNMTPEQAERADKAVRAIDPDVTVEVSGGITPETAERYAAFADVISLGWLTHSVRSVDFSLNVA